MSNLNVTVTEIEYHRNGVSGEGFHVCKFTDDENGNMIGIVFEDEKYCAVLNLDMLKENEDIRFMYNSWHGDRYEPYLRKAIEDNNQKWMTQLNDNNKQ